MRTCTRELHDAMSRLLAEDQTACVFQSRWCVRGQGGQGGQGRQADTAKVRTIVFERCPPLPPVLAIARPVVWARSAQQPRQLFVTHSHTDAWLQSSREEAILLSTPSRRDM
jgi:hypothetical protein